MVITLGEKWSRFGQVRPRLFTADVITSLADSVNVTAGEGGEIITRVLNSALIDAGWNLVIQEGADFILVNKIISEAKRSSIEIVRKHTSGRKKFKYLSENLFLILMSKAKKLERAIFIRIKRNPLVRTPWQIIIDTDLPVKKLLMNAAL